MANAPAVEPCAKAFDAAALSTLFALAFPAALGFCDFAALLLVGVFFFVALVVVVFLMVLAAPFVVVFALGALLLLGMLLLLGLVLLQVSVAEDLIYRL